ncbi:Guanylyl cyclase [Legionella geestiana]|uniref:Guanylyl cyclase n=1 Tax=Legionella geestiana TaxID=45065 RepID=A0A0W0U7U9_9GAMM|nr:hypothetical protein [Legionella geestiana]KTD04062.1 Guanylyl cyclase [Legionella geestiana]QBS12076.1 peptidase-C39 like family protein [Legionella geestiana]QDQ40317.1 peptidase-C39 like family protein [Legionella geestiana]STX53203.1 Guanylyl cyclase [Legionella geestiana]
MIAIDIHTQPNDETCGPTSLHAVYRYFGVDISLETVIAGVERSMSGGTLAALLGVHALTLGFEATVYVTNLETFDLTWFHHGGVDTVKLTEKLHQQLRHKHTPGIVQDSAAFLRFLALGGNVRFETLSIQLLKSFFAENLPVITGLSATYLYQCPREVFTDDGQSTYDDIKGTPCGHFVVLCGYDEHHRHIVVADPHRENPLSHDNYYKVSSTRLMNAIHLGVLTHDANLLVIKPRDSRPE